MTSGYNFEDDELFSLPAFNKLRSSSSSPPPSPQAVLSSGKIPEEILRRRQDRRKDRHREPLIIERPVNSADVDHVPGEIEHDPYLFDLYIKAISQGEETDKCIRVNIVGNYAQGKTSLAKRLVGQTTDDVQSTNSVDIYSCQYVNGSRSVKFSVKNNLEGDSKIVDRIASIARSEKVNATSTYSSEEDFQLSLGIEAAQYKLMMPPGKEKIDEDKKEKILNEKDETDRKKVFVGEQFETHRIPSTDPQRSPLNSKRHQAVTKEELKLFAQRLESNRNDSDSIGDIDMWDFGGQFIFYSTHTLFHSRRAIYLLVFDLSLPLSELSVDKEYPGEIRKKID